MNPLTEIDAFCFIFMRKNSRKKSINKITINVLIWFVQRKKQTNLMKITEKVHTSESFLWGMVLYTSYMTHVLFNHSLTAIPN